MKLYNIRESKSFFEKLSTCRGKVEIINSEGRPIILKVDYSVLASLHLYR